MKSSTEMIDYYKSGFLPEHWMDSIMWQYIDMAQGGTGGSLGFTERGKTTCRGINYPHEPDAFFQEVCDGMGWKWRESQ